MLADRQRTWDADLWWIAAAHWADLCSDFSAVHHVGWSQVGTMDAREFGALAARLVHYPGAVQAAALKAYRAQQPGAQQQAPASTSEAPGTPVDPTPEQVRAMRDAARRKRFDPAKYGEHKYVGLDEFMREASRG